MGIEGEDKSGLLSSIEGDCLHERALFGLGDFLDRRKRILYGKCTRCGRSATAEVSEEIISEYFPQV